MSTKKIQTGIRFQPELLYKITQIAKENKRSLNAQLEYLAESCVKEYEKENGVIEIDENILYSKWPNIKNKSSIIFANWEW